MTDEPIKCDENMLANYRAQMADKFADMTKEEIQRWEDALKDAVEIPEEVQKMYDEVKEANRIQALEEQKWRDENRERVKSFFYEHWDEVYTKNDDFDRNSVIYDLSTEIFDAHGHHSLDPLLEDIKKTFPDLYLEVLEGFVSGCHDT